MGGGGRRRQGGGHHEGHEEGAAAHGPQVRAAQQGSGDSSGMARQPIAQACRTDGGSPRTSRSPRWRWPRTDRAPLTAGLCHLARPSVGFRGAVRTRRSGRDGRCGSRPVRGGDGGLAASFGEGDHAGVGGVEARVGVGGDELGDAGPVAVGEGLDGDLPGGDGRIEGSHRLRRCGRACKKPSNTSVSCTLDVVVSAAVSSRRRISHPASAMTSAVVTSGRGDLRGARGIRGDQDRYPSWPSRS